MVCRNLDMSKLTSMHLPSPVTSAAPHSEQSNSICVCSDRILHRNPSLQFFWTHLDWLLDWQSIYSWDPSTAIIASFRKKAPNSLPSFNFCQQKTSRCSWCVSWLTNVGHCPAPGSWYLILEGAVIHCSLSPRSPSSPLVHFLVLAMKLFLCSSSFSSNSFNLWL